jgi:hypothetical protein
MQNHNTSEPRAPPRPESDSFTMSLGSSLNGSREAVLGERSRRERFDRGSERTANAGVQPFSPKCVFAGTEIKHMMITVLAAAMTVLMLIATVFGLHQEAERVRFDKRSKRTAGFGWE